jgi:hypothetical protein
MVSILLLVLGALSLGAALTFLLLTIPTLNKKLKQEDPTSFCLLGSGFSLALYSVLCLAALLLLS